MLPAMRVDDFDYDLPPDRIAQAPAARREAARLLVPDPAGGPSRHGTVADLPGLLRAGDLLVVNDTRVRRARLFARRPSGGRVELLLLGPRGDEPAVWTALVNPARKLRVGQVLTIEGPEDEPLTGWELEPLERLAHDAEADKPGPGWVLRFGRTDAPGAGPVDAAAIEALCEAAGHVPLPPYIERAQGRGDAERAREAADADRYQTVFAREPGAVAAPTAGLHLTEALLAELETAGVERAAVTLHVGLGTFAPVEVEDPDDHPMHTEALVLPEATVAAVERTRARGGRVVCVGTTSLRVLEARADADGRLTPGAGSTDLFLRPGSPFRVCDVLLTNFHLPKSTLLMLVSAFVGRERILELYAEAIAEGYRFFSYGDAMLLERPG